MTQELVFKRLCLDTAATPKLCSTPLGLDKDNAAILIKMEMKTTILKEFSFACRGCRIQVPPFKLVLKPT